MSKKVFNFVVILLLIVLINNFASPILNKSSSFQKAYAKSEDLDKESLKFYMDELNKQLLQDAPILNDWRFNIIQTINTILTPSMAKNYKDLCERAITLRNLASYMLNEAYAEIDNNDLVNANKHYQLANKYYMMSCQLLSTASQIAPGIITNAQSILDGVRKGLEGDFKFLAPFVAVELGLPPWVGTITADVFSNGLEMFVAKSEGKTLIDIAKKELVSDAVGLLFDKFSSYLSTKLGIYDLKDVYFDSEWTRNCSLLEQLKYYISSDKTLIPSLISEISSKGIDLITSEKIVDSFLSGLDSIISGSVGGGGGVGGLGRQSLDKVQLSSPRNALVLQPGNITFFWNPVSNATKYEFKLYNSLGQIMQDTVVSKFSTSILRTFDAEGTFTWMVKAGDDYDNWGPWSDTWSVIIRNTSAQPYFKVLVDKGCGSTYKIGDVIKISGESNITANGTLYSYWSDGSVKTYPVPFIANQTVPFVSSPLDGATGLRRYKVVVNYQGQTYESNECSITCGVQNVTQSLLPAPTLSSPSNGQTNASTTPTFSWSPVTGANYYWLTVATNSSYLPTDPNAKTAPGCVISTNVTGTSYPSPTLNQGTTYYWEVQAFYRTSGTPDRVGYYSSVWMFTTASAATLGQVQLSSPGNGVTLPPMNVTFIWNSVSNATKYEIIIYNHLGQAALDQTTTNLYIIVALGTEETITWKVRAGDNSGNWGSWSNTWSLTIKK